jgi:hypothetical protein
MSQIVKVGARSLASVVYFLYELCELELATFIYEIFFYLILYCIMFAIFIS